MKVLYDHQAFTGLKFGGVARYFYELLSDFSQREDVDFDLALRFSNNEYLTGASFSNHSGFTNFLDYVTTNKVVSFVNRLNSLRYIRLGEYDIFHPTYYHKYFLNHIGNKPFVLTFHDTTNEKYHQQFPALGGDMFELKQTLLERATRVIAVSENTKQEMLSYFDVDESKVDVIYHGTAFTQIVPNGAAEKVITPPHFLLYVGNRSDFKNFNFFIKSVKPLLVQHADLQVVCAGGKRFSPEERKYLSELGLTDRVLHHHIESDEMLFVLYQRALAFVFPSLNEGFGIPILEAFATGCPVVLSNASCFPEIASDAAVYFQPQDADSILYAVKEVVDSQSLRQILIKRGTERIRLFSGQETANKTLDVYRKALLSR